ncbi:hypothetical protein IMG5_145440 [Ichthyophthirius multifiliis]|uniref:Beta'-coat protein n=1 Tax=Ichthyophthirius multifiliis TaxID=5932 RepID=G0QXV6_ICHMU|nr:hypothetical protein IMG5_145440 [Ichthyophthirius multifiliis]EGR29953.1 hypothetical protein IMG5_145440 [Ichthyophthirius multifiliis]|eukprot:XP_004031189.1 hypothetical protein IMG5_145440 [Ichthyophthirius multifiliis]
MNFDSNGDILHISIIDQIKKICVKQIQDIKQNEDILPKHEDIWKIISQDLIDQNKSKEKFNSNFQRKIDQIENENNIFEKQKTLINSQKEIIIVASLLEKVPNIAHLTRTGEVFGISQLIIPNKQIIQTEEFKNVSVTAEKWLPLMEIKEEDLLKFLYFKKHQGFMLIGLEQTSQSQFIQNFQFPNKCILLLGKEKTGIPPEYIEILDMCIEIPQFGQIRSLNVHISAVICIWEFPLKFEIKKKMISRSERVKCIELHTELPWVMVSLYSGNITIYDYSTQTIAKTFENSPNPVRASKFVTRKQWIVAGSDDLQIRVYNYNTMEKIKQWEAHSDYIRYILIHPSEPYILSSSDDANIKMWDFEKNFTLVRSFEGHIHYVMMLIFNPRDSNIFASASIDKTIKIWNISNNKPNFSLVGHEQGVNCLDYHRGEHNYLISGGDDRLVKIWDCSTKQCIHTLEGHTQNVTCVLFHPELPIIITGGEDGFAKIWHSQTFKLETSLNYNLDRVWSLDVCKDSSNVIAIGCDEGSVIVKIGSDEPVVSLKLLIFFISYRKKKIQKSNGKIIYAKNLEVFTSNLKAINTTEDNIKEGENIPGINVKDLGAADFYPTGLRHAPNGHSFALFNDSEYCIYRSTNFKSIIHGQGTDLAWANNGDYAVKDNFIIRIYKGNNELQYELKTDYMVENIFGGTLLCAKSNEFLIFYDWETGKIIRRLDSSVNKIYWNITNNLISIATSEAFYVLEYKQELVKELMEREGENAEGYEEAFELQYEINENINSGLWVEQMFFFTNQTGKISYSLMGRVFTFAYTEKKKIILGYVNFQNRIYFFDKFFNVSSFEIPIQVAQFQCLIAKEEIERAQNLLENIEKKYYDKLAKFLDTIDKKELAFQIAIDIDHKFDLALQLGNINEANNIAQQTKNINQQKQVGDLALQKGNINLAIECFKNSDDLGSLLLIYSSLGLKEELIEIAQKAVEQTKMNIAFQIYFYISDLDNCIDILIKTNRYSEAALFAKTYCPSKISQIVLQWKEDLQKNHHLVIAQKIADPMDFLDDESFSDLKILLQLEEFYITQRQNNSDLPSYVYEDYEKLLNADLFMALKKDPSRNLSCVSLKPKDIPNENPLYLQQQ